MGNYGTNSTTGGLEFYINQNKLNIWIAAGVSSSIGSIQANTRYYVVATRQSGTVKLYINGVQDGVGTLATAITSILNWTIGNGPNYTSEIFEGKIDEPRIYNRALTS